MTLPIETLKPPPPPAMGPSEAKALLAYLQAATEAHDPAVSEGDRVLLCSAVAWLQRVAEAEGPFGGWTIGAWRDDNLWAEKDGIADLVGTLLSGGRWSAWIPTRYVPFAEGREPGDTPKERLTAARRACENALRARGAKL